MLKPIKTINIIIFIALFMFHFSFSSNAESARIYSKSLAPNISLGPMSEIYEHDGIKYMKGADLGTFKLTGYCACKKCSSGTGITFSGKHVREKHTVAADLNILPLGTYIILEGSGDGESNEYNGVYQVEDKGGGVKDKHIDIYMPTHDLASLVTYHRYKYSHVYLAVPIS